MAAKSGPVVLRIKRKRSEDPLDALRKLNILIPFQPLSYLLGAQANLHCQVLYFPVTYFERT